MTIAQCIDLLTAHGWEIRIRRSADDARVVILQVRKDTAAQWYEIKCIPAAGADLVLTQSFRLLWQKCEDS